MEAQYSVYKPYLDPLATNASSKDLFGDKNASKAPDVSNGQRLFAALTKLGDHAYKHPNYLSHAEKQTVPLGAPRAQSSYPLPERLRFNPFPVQQRFMWPGEYGKLYNEGKGSESNENPGNTQRNVLFGVTFAAMVLALILAIN